MKSWIVIALFSLIPLSLFAQKDQKAKGILQKTASTLKNSGGIRANFEGTQEGTIWMDNQLFYLNAAGIESWYDGKTLWSYVADNDEVNVSNPTSEELQAINPYLIIQSFKEGFDYQYRGMRNQNSQKVHEIALTPEIEQDLSALTLFINESYIPIYIKLVQSNQEIEFKVTNYKLQQQFKKSDFSFDKKKYPEAEIIDLR